MKKKLTSKLKLNKTRLHILSRRDTDQIKAGEDVVEDSQPTRPRTYACIAPYNAPPYYYGPVYPELETIE